MGTTGFSRSPRTGDWSPSPKVASIPRMALPLPLPPTPRLDKNTTTPSPAASVADSKLAAIKSYRRALGLCYKCGMKWSKDHKCSPEVLHAVEVLWEAVADEECQSGVDPTSAHDEQLCLALSKAASGGPPASRTIRFRGSYY